MTALGSLDVWCGPFSKVRHGLHEAIIIIDKWIKVTFELTSTFWASYSGHSWIGTEPYRDEYMNNLLKRIEEVLRIRTTHEELLKLLTKDQIDRLGLSSSFYFISSCYLLLKFYSLHLFLSNRCS